MCLNYDYRKAIVHFLTLAHKARLASSVEKKKRHICQVFFVDANSNVQQTELNDYCSLFRNPNKPLFA